MNIRNIFYSRALILAAMVLQLQHAPTAYSATELAPTYMTSLSNTVFDSRWEAEQEILNAGAIGSELATPTFIESLSYGITRTAYEVVPEFVPKTPLFQPLFYSGENQAGLNPCSDCPLFDQFGIQRCGDGNTWACADYASILAAIDNKFSGSAYCEHRILEELPWYFTGYTFGGALPDGTAAYRIQYNRVIKVEYRQKNFNCITPGWQTWNWIANSFSFNACPTGYYDAGTVNPETGEPSCSNHYFAWLYEYNGIEHGGDCPSGNPCYPKTGVKSLAEADFASPTLELTRSWNSAARYPDHAAMGRGWTHNYSQRVIDLPGTLKPTRILLDGKGTLEYFVCFDQPQCLTFRSIRNPGSLLRPDGGGGWEVYSPDGDLRRFDGMGRLVRIQQRGAAYNDVTISYSGGKVDRVRDQAGRELVFSYTPAGLVDSVTLPSGGTVRYAYERPPSVPAHVPGRQRLTGVEREDLTERTYHYEDQHPDGSPRFEYLVTGVTDENGVRYATYAYDGNGRVISSGHALGAELVTLDYTNRPGESQDWTITEVTMPLGEVMTYEMYPDLFRKLGRLTDSRGSFSVEHDPATSWIVERRDRNGNRTTHAYADSLHETHRTEAAGTPLERTIATEWDNTVNRVTERREPGKVMDFTYNARGQVLTRTETAANTSATRIWTYAYFEEPDMAELVGRLRSVDGPRNDVSDTTTYDYYTEDAPDGWYRKGDLRKVTNAAGHVTEYLAYDGNGRLLQMKDPNGILTTFSYHPRGWIESRAVNGQATWFEYDNVGNMTRIILPDGSYTDFEYDEAHRLVALADMLGNRIEYVLDAAGNRTLEQIFDDQEVIRHRVSRVFDGIGRLRKVIDGRMGETGHDYDDNGNRSSILDPNLRLTSFEYDALDRLIRIIDDNQGETSLSYDQRDNLAAISDPIGGTTVHSSDGLDNRVMLDSPDTGSTVYEYDDAGNRIASTDARGVRVDYGYDALNRPVSVSYPDSTQDVSFHYDAQSNGVGRLVGMDDAAGMETYAYDARGNLVTLTRNFGAASYSTGFAFNGADRLIGITYPSGMVIEYTLNTAGRVIAVDKTIDSVTETLVDGVTYEPFGPVTQLIFGNALEMNATYDLDHAPETLQSGPGLDWTFAYDLRGNVVEIADQASPADSQGFTYDNLYRLQTATGPYGEETFEYDANGNRTRFLSGTSDTSYSYEPQSNRLAGLGNWTLIRDAAGNRIRKLDNAGLGYLYAYGDHNRISSVSIRSAQGDEELATYVHDGRGQRVIKRAGGVTTHYIFGPGGELLGEYRDDAEPDVEYVYLNGRLVAVVATQWKIPEPPPSVLVVDNEDAGTSSNGSWSYKSSPEAIAGSHRLSRKNANATFRWAVHHPAWQSSSIEVNWVAHKSHSDRAQYTIVHEGGTDVVEKNQKVDGGQWNFLGEYTGVEYVEIDAANGKTSADAVRFKQQVPPGQPELTESVGFVHTDHLGTPRAVSDTTQSLVWLWNSTPFADTIPVEDPDGDGKSYRLNLRFPGQYYDEESGLFYNYFRDYDPSAGRYIQGDPAGLLGSLNIYSYAENAPLQFVDPRGLMPRGSWIRPPRYNVTDFGILSGEFITPYLNEWGYLKVFRLHGYATGFVNIDIRCQDTLDCAGRDWEIHERIVVPYSGYKDLGPNAAATAAGSIAGPLAGAAATILALGGSSLGALLDFLREAKALGADKVKWLLEIGPTAICRGGFQ